MLLLMFVILLIVQWYMLSRRVQSFYYYDIAMINIIIIIIILLTKFSHRFYFKDWFSTVYSVSTFQRSVLETVAYTFNIMFIFNLFTMSKIICRLINIFFLFIFQVSTIIYLTSFSFSGRLKVSIFLLEINSNHEVAVKLYRLSCFLLLFQLSHVGANQKLFLHYKFFLFKMFDFT